MEILVGLLGTLLFGLIPMLVYAALLWWFDRYEKEPLPLLLAAFLWGAVPAVILSLIAELIFDFSLSQLASPGLVSDVLSTAMAAPIIEELAKAAALAMLLLLFRQEIDSPIDGVIYGGLVGFGFAAVENTLYFVSGWATAGLGGAVLVGCLRSFLFGLNHALFSGLTGLGVALARTARPWGVKLGAPLLGLLAGMAVHALHNLGSTLAGQLCWPILVSFVVDWGGVLGLLSIIVLLGLREQQVIARYLQDEVDRHTLTQAQYRVIVSYWQRVSQQAATLLRGQPGRWLRQARFHHLATELAFKQHRLEQFARERDTQRHVEQLRQQVAVLSAQL